MIREPNERPVTRTDDEERTQMSKRPMCRTPFVRSRHAAPTTFVVPTTIAASTNRWLGAVGSSTTFGVIGTTERTFPGCLAGGLT